MRPNLGIICLSTLIMSNVHCTLYSVQCTLDKSKDWWHLKRESVRGVSIFRLNVTSLKYELRKGVLFFLGLSYKP